MNVVRASILHRLKYANERWEQRRVEELGIPPEHGNTRVCSEKWFAFAKTNFEPPEMDRKAVPCSHPAGSQRHP